MMSSSLVLQSVRHCIQHATPMTALFSSATISEYMPRHAQIVEVGPRDGLQSEHQSIPTETKIQMIDMLSKSGISRVEATSFVSPKWVPQLADADAVMRGIQRHEDVQYSVLTPNMKAHAAALATQFQAASSSTWTPAWASKYRPTVKARNPRVQGFERAVQARVDSVAIFAAATDEFSQRNINCTVEESLRRFQPVAREAQAKSIPIRGYVSVAVNCPYTGAVPPQAAANVAQELLRMGCFEVSIGDTTGRATTRGIEDVLHECTRHAPIEVFAGHFHDTYGQALPNVMAALRLGVTTFDSSVGGLGGCPYAPGASGNVATEDLIYMLSGLGVEHGVNLDELVDCSMEVCRALGKQNGSKVATAILAARTRSTC